MSKNVCLGIKIWFGIVFHFMVNNYDLFFFGLKCGNKFEKNGIKMVNKLNEKTR